MASDGDVQEMPTKRHFVDLDEFDGLMWRALGSTYSVRDKFDNESDFKFELYHNLHQLKLNGHRLGFKLPGYSTCLLHAEAKAENGNPSKADLLVCNPTRRNPFNYSVEVVIELKTTLNSRALRAELKKFTGTATAISAGCISYQPTEILSARPRNLGSLRNIHRPSVSWSSLTDP